MPAKAVLFDQRVNPIHSFDSHPWNFISFNPQARLLALAGFGNLAGKIDVFDRRTLQKITTIDAPNTSYCEWSGDGKSLMTATLSPRLRVDNGIKIWHCTGPLMHVHPIEELYQVFLFFSIYRFFLKSYETYSRGIDLMETKSPRKCTSIRERSPHRTSSFQKCSVERTKYPNPYVLPLLLFSPPSHPNPTPLQSKQASRSVQTPRRTRSSHTINLQT
jgi:uncharacterized protein with WD repeat